MASEQLRFEIPTPGRRVVGIVLSAGTLHVLDGTTKQAVDGPKASAGHRSKNSATRFFEATCPGESSVLNGRWMGNDKKSLPAIKVTINA